MSNQTSSSQDTQSNDYLGMLGVAALAIVLALALLAGIASMANSQSSASSVSLPVVMSEPAGTGIPAGGTFDTVTVITHAGDERLFVGQRTGEIFVLHPDGSQEMFLDLSDQVWSNGAEFGLYDIAFHPNFSENGLFYVSYSSLITPHIYVVLNRFRLENGDATVDPTTAATYIQIYQKSQIHKGGGLDFDLRTNTLYMGIGEDAEGWLAQDPQSPQGKVLGLAVDDVPAASTGSVLDQFRMTTWGLGLRNPWRIDVDEASGNLYVADVSAEDWDEINVAPLETTGTNFGWPCRQGFHDYDLGVEVPACEQAQILTDPVFALSHEAGHCAIIGGSVYRPADDPEDGRYFFSDLCSRDLYAFPTGTAPADPTLSLGVISESAILTLGDDNAGNLYAGVSAAESPIYKLAIPPGTINTDEHESQLQPYP